MSVGVRGIMHLYCCIQPVVRIYIKYSVYRTTRQYPVFVRKVERYELLLYEYVLELILIVRYHAGTRLESRK